MKTMRVVFVAVATLIAGPALADYRITRDHGGEIKSYEAKYERLRDAGERVIIDTGHQTPTPDGLYAIRDTFENIVVKRLQVLRSARPTRVQIISDNPNHPSEEAPLGEVEIVGKVLCCLKLF